MAKSPRKHCLKSRRATAKDVKMVVDFLPRKRKVGVMIGPRSPAALPLTPFGQGRRLASEFGWAITASTDCNPRRPTEPRPKSLGCEDG